MLTHPFRSSLRPGRALIAAVVVSMASVSFAPTAVYAQATQPVKVLKAGESSTDNLPVPEAEPDQRANPTGTTQPASTGSSLGFDLSRLAFALVIVIGLIFLARWFVSRMFAGTRAPTASRAIKVLGRAPLAPRQQILLLQVGRRVIVVGESNGQLNTLANVDDPDEVATLIGQLQEEHISRASSFGGLFQRAEKKFDEEAEAPASTSTNPSSASPEEATNEAEVRSELSGLAEKLRMIRSQMNRPPER